MPEMTYNDFGIWRGASPCPGREAGLAKKLIIILVNTDPRNGEELGAPFFQATVAAAG